MGTNLKGKLFIFVIISIIIMSTISVTENVKESLLKVALELQLKLGRRIDLNEAIRYLLTKGIKETRSS